MPAFRPRIRALLVAVGAFALISVAAGGTLAASTNPPTLYACFNTSGQVAMATTPQCKLTGGGQLAYWSTQGVPGPTGPTGASGATGATGAQGPAGPGSATRLLAIPKNGSLHDLFSGSGWSVVLSCGLAGPSAGLQGKLGFSGTAEYSSAGDFNNSLDAGAGSVSGSGGSTRSFGRWIDLSATDGTAVYHATIHKMADDLQGNCVFTVTE